MKQTCYIVLPIVIILMIFISCHPTEHWFSNRTFLRQLSNMDYKIDDRIISLEKGTFSEEILPGSASKLQVKLSEWLALGDINADQKSDAVVVLIENTGGSGTFYHLIPVIRQGKSPHALHAIMLGDRISMVSLNIENQRINVVYLEHSSKEAMSSPPSREIQRHFILKDKMITEVKNTSMNVALIISACSP